MQQEELRFFLCCRFMFKVRESCRFPLTEKSRENERKMHFLKMRFYCKIAQTLDDWKCWKRDEDLVAVEAEFLSTSLSSFIASSDSSSVFAVFSCI